LAFQGHGKLTVEEILDSKMVRQRLKYLVKWAGYYRPDWEPAENMNGLAVVDEFHRLYPEKPGPLPEDQDWVQGSLELNAGKGRNVTAMASD